jgi:hypothetical protein
MKHPQYTTTVAIHGDIDHAAGDVPEWCDLSVDITSTEHHAVWVSAWDEQVTLYMTRKAGEAIIDAMHKTLHPWAGGSLVQLMEKDLDAVVDRLLSGKAQDGEKDMARGMAMMIARLRQPYNPDWTEVRDASVARVKTGVRVEPNPNKSRRGH